MGGRGRVGEGEGYLHELGMDGRGQFNLSFSLSICWPLTYLLLHIPS